MYYIHRWFKIFLVDIFGIKKCKNSRNLSKTGRCCCFFSIHNSFRFLKYNIGCSKKNIEWFLGKTGWYFPKMCLNSNISFISTSHLKKKVAFKVMWQKSYRLGNFRKTACPKKYLALKSFILKTVLVVNITFLFRVSSLKKQRIYEQIEFIFLENIIQSFLKFP